MRRPLRLFAWTLLLCGMLAASGRAKSGAAFQSTFASPPDESRPLMRWWWFGPAVTDAELSRELHVMKEAGLGGVEIQPVYPLSLDDPAHGVGNLPYLSPGFLDSVRFANTTARSLGLRVDITLGSGWPYGGPGTTLALSAGRLKLIALANPAVPPAPAPEDALIAAFCAPGTPVHWRAEGATRIALTPAGALVHATLAATSAPSVLLLFYASHTRQQVKRAAVGAEGFVLDHFSRAAIEEHLGDVADKLSGAFGPQPPYSVFSDSLEVYGSDWTAALPAEFQRRRGYDLIPHLPELYAGGTPQAKAVRNDWGRTLSDLIRENYLQPIEHWAIAHHTLFRSQTYGEPAVTLADEAVAALPEGEGPQWRQFSFTRWATSASHLYQRSVTSAETFTWLHSPVFRATPLDMKVEADRMFLSGVNQIIGHGWPYTPPGAAEPGWNLYAAAVFNDHNPWFPVMPDVVRYLHRASWLLRQGQPANDVAILLPEDDAQAAFTPGHVAVTDEMKRRITPALTSSILDAGYNFDYIDAATLDKLGRVPYAILILPPTSRIPLSTYKLLAAYAAHGGHLIALGTLPSLAPGLEHQADDSAVEALTQQLFHGGRDQRQGSGPGISVPKLSDLPAALHDVLPPDLAATNLPDPAQSGGDANAGFGFIHRRLPDADVYFVVNSSSSPLSTSLTFRARHTSAMALSLDSGKPVFTRAGSSPIPIQLAPYESMVFYLTDASRIEPEVPLRSGDSSRALGSGWRIAFPGAPAQPLAPLSSWTGLSNREFYSGEAIYTNTFEVESSSSGHPRTYTLDFGTGSPVPDTRRPDSAGIHALLDTPIRDAATVFVNGKRAGSLWHPPYAIEISQFVHPGHNTVAVHVYNTAVNLLAGQPPRDYTALNAKYGKRFDPQDMNLIKSLPSGLLGPVRLLISKAR